MTAIMIARLSIRDICGILWKYRVIEKMFLANFTRNSEKCFFWFVIHIYCLKKEKNTNDFPDFSFLTENIGTQWLRHIFTRNLGSAQRVRSTFQQDLHTAYQIWRFFLECSHHPSKTNFRWRSFQTCPR